MLSFDDIEGYLKYYAQKYQDRNTEYWELINEAWIRIHELEKIEFASQGIRWAMSNYKQEQYAQIHRRNRNSKIISLECLDEYEAPSRDYEDIEWILNNLNMFDRAIVWLKFMDGLNNKQIAKMYKVTHQAISLRVRNAIKKLRSKVA